MNKCSEEALCSDTLQFQLLINFIELSELIFTMLKVQDDNNVQ